MFSSLEARLVFFGENEKLPDYGDEYAAVHAAARELPSATKFLAVQCSLQSEISRLRLVEQLILELESGDCFSQEEILAVNNAHRQADDCRRTICRLTESARRCWQSARTDIIALERTEVSKLVAAATADRESLFTTIIPKIEKLAAELCERDSEVRNRMFQFKPQAAETILGQEPVLNESDWLATKATS